MITKLKIKQPDSGITQNREGSKHHLKRQNVLVERILKVNKNGGQYTLPQTKFSD